MKNNDKKNIELTDDPLTNILLMIPMLNERSKQAMSYMMYGCVIGEEMAKANNEQIK